MNTLCRPLAVLFSLSLGVGSAFAAITEVASQRATSAACNAVDTCALAFPNNVTAGNLLVGGGAFSDNEANTVTVTDTVGTSYSVLPCTEIDAAFDTTPFLFYGIAAGAGANTVTVDPVTDASVSQMHFSVDEFTGNHATPLDVDGGSSTGTSTTPADSITTLTANDLLLGVVGSNASQTISVGSGYTQIGEDESALDAFNLEFQIVTTAQAYSVNWTTSGSNAWSACTAAFKEAVTASERAFGRRTF